jgi:large subunit ribosomal protein L17
MRHRKPLKKLSRSPAHRRALIRNLLTSLITHGAIETTQTRCKVLKREVDKLITLGKKGSVHARRIAATRLFGKDAVGKLFDEIAPRYEDRHGGYSRILLLGPRLGDAAERAMIQLLPADEQAGSASLSLDDQEPEVSEE